MTHTHTHTHTLVLDTSNEPDVRGEQPLGTTVLSEDWDHSIYLLKCSSQHQQGCVCVCMCMCVCVCDLMCVWQQGQTEVLYSLWTDRVTEH